MARISMTILLPLLCALAVHSYAQDKYRPGPKSETSWKLMYHESHLIAQKVIDDNLHEKLCAEDANIATMLANASAALIGSGQADRAIVRQRAQEAGRYIAGAYCPEKK